MELLREKINKTEKSYIIFPNITQWSIENITNFNNKESINQKFNEKTDTKTHYINNKTYKNTDDINNKIYQNDDNINKKTDQNIDDINNKTDENIDINNKTDENIDDINNKTDENIDINNKTDKNIDINKKTDENIDINNKTDENIDDINNKTDQNIDDINYKTDFIINEIHNTIDKNPVNINKNIDEIKNIRNNLQPIEFIKEFLELYEDTNSIKQKLFNFISNKKIEIKYTKKGVSCIMDGLIKNKWNIYICKMYSYILEYIFEYRNGVIGDVSKNKNIKAYVCK